MSNLKITMPLIEALTTPAQQMLEQVKAATAQSVPHWTEYLRDCRDDKS